MSATDTSFRLATKRSTGKGGDAFHMDVKPSAAPPIMKKGFYAIQITGAEKSLNKSNKPMLTITLDCQSDEQEGTGIRLWIGDWNPEMYVNLLKLAGSTVELGLPSVSALIGVTGYALLEEGLFNSRATTNVKNLITREQMEEGGFPIPFESDLADTDDVDADEVGAQE
jgi:hypothetical protein